MSKLFLIGVAALALSGCGTSWPSGSYAKINDGDGPVLASAIANYVGGAVEAGVPIKIESDSKDTMGNDVRDALTHIGMADQGNGTPVKYVATPIEGGELLRVSVGDDRGMAQVFKRGDDGNLVPGGPQSVVVP